MLRSALTLTAALVALTACGDTPTALRPLPDDPQVEPRASPETVTLVALVAGLAEDEFTHAVLEEVEDEALARYLRGTLRRLDAAARTGARSSVLRVLESRPLEQLGREGSRLSPGDELAVAEMEILLGYVEWWLDSRLAPAAADGSRRERSGVTGS